MIKDKSELQTALIDSVMACDLDCVRRLLLEGANPDVGLDEAQVTPLHFAAQNSMSILLKSFCGMVLTLRRKQSLMGKRHWI